jgi:ADP-dependent phosphofructokinase/glucokinase
MTRANLVTRLQMKQLSRWIVMGDFNLIYRAQDKSNGRVNRPLMNGFRIILDDLELKELHLHGRRYIFLVQQHCNPHAHEDRSHFLYQGPGTDIPSLSSK